MEWTIFCTVLDQKKAEHSKNGLKIAIFFLIFGVTGMFLATKNNPQNWGPRSFLEKHFFLSLIYKLVLFCTSSYVKRAENIKNGLKISGSLIF